MKHLSIPIAILSCMALTGCMDDSYDLNDIDMTLGTTANLTLPTSSTSGIYLKNFLDLKEDGVIQYVEDLTTGDSILCVKQHGEAKIDDVNIDEIVFPKPAINAIELPVNMTPPNAPTTPAPALAGTPQLGGQRISLPDLIDDTFEYTIQPDNKFSYDIDGATASGISTDVVSLTKVGINEATMDIEMRVTGFPTWLTCIHLKNLHLSVPEELIVTKCVFNGSERYEGSNEIALTDGGNSRVPLNDGEAFIKLDITFGGIKTGDNLKFNSDEHELLLEATKLAVDGSFQIKTDDVDQTKLQDYIESLTPEIIAEIIRTGSLGSVMPEAINLSGTAEFDKDFKVTTVSGELKHDVGQVEPIKMNDMPDFLNDPGVVLDLKNPLLMLCAESDLLENSTITTSMQIHSTTTEEDVKTEDFTLSSTDGQNRTLLYMADSPDTPRPDDYKHATRINYTSGSGTIAGLIRQIPEEVEIKIVPVTVTANDLDITKRYPISVDYDIYVPFTLGPDFELVYRGNPEKGWADDVSDLEKIDAGSIELKAMAKSTLPATLLVTIFPIDTEGNTIPDKMLKVNNVEVKANSTTPITITIKPGEGYSMNDILAGKNGAKQLDGVKYEARIKDPSENSPSMRKDAMIQLTDVKVTIIGNIIYDAN